MQPPGWAGGETSADCSVLHHLETLSCSEVAPASRRARPGQNRYVLLVGAYTGRTQEDNVSRTGQIWRGELAQQIEAHLAGALSADALVAWAVDHPLFDDQRDLDSEEFALIGRALGCVLQRSPEELPATRTTDAELEAMVHALWGTPFRPDGRG
jgi:hypothetical protein